MPTMTTRKVKLWNTTEGTVTKWTATYEGGPEPMWTFTPPAALIDAITKGDFAVPTTQPATQAVTQPN